MATKKKTTKKKMTSELPPRAQEVPGAVAMGLLGYEYLASVRKLKDLGEIEGRKVGRDWWYDRRSIDAYNERRRPVGRPAIEDADDDGTEREYQRFYQRDRRAGKLRRAAKSGSSKKAERAAKAARGGRAVKGKAATKGKASGAAARGGAGKERAGGKSGRK